jgi:uncharacterized small protein (DUF1192 family)
MADGTNSNATTADTTATATSQQAQGSNDSTTTDVNELYAKIASLQATVDKQNTDLLKSKSTNDRLSKEIADNKKSSRANMTETEKTIADLNEKLNATMERLEASETENNHSKAVNAYRNLNDEKTIEALIEAVSEKDHNAIASIIETEKTTAFNAGKADVLKDSQRLNTGNAYSSMTKDQILAIPDRAERLRAIALNQELFNK